MRTPILVGAAVAALLLTGGGVALAQTTPSAAVKAAICASASVDAVSAAADQRVVNAKAGKVDADAALLKANTAADKADPDIGSVTGRTAVEARIAQIKKHIETVATTGPERAAFEVKLKARQDQLAAIGVAEKADTEQARALSAQADAVDLEAEVATFVGTRSFGAVKTELCTTPPVTTSPSPTPTTAPTTTPGDDDGGPLYATCAEATAAGAAPMSLGEPGYLASLDSDDDGVACEIADDTALPVGGAATGG